MDQRGASFSIYLQKNSTENGRNLCIHHLLIHFHETVSARRKQNEIKTQQNPDITFPDLKFSHV